jgi:hypothetical protein
MSAEAVGAVLAVAAMAVAVFLILKTGRGGG